MKPHLLLPLSVLTAAGMFVAVAPCRATVYTFDVDSSSGIGTGSFTIDLPDAWPGNLGHSTVYQAATFRGFYGRGDRWTSLTVTLNEFLEQPNSAGLSGQSKRLVSFHVAAPAVGITPADALDNLPGVTRRSQSLTRNGAGIRVPATARATAAGRCAGRLLAGSSLQGNLRGQLVTTPATGAFELSNPAVGCKSSKLHRHRAAGVVRGDRDMVPTARLT